MKRIETSVNKSILWVLLLAVPILVAIVYLKLETDDSVEEMGDFQGEQPKNVAVPDTTVSIDAAVVDIPDTVRTPPCATISRDTRSAVEAGDEDGYWDGWYDGAETGERMRYDDHSNYTSQKEKTAYAMGYREGYDKGFQEGLEQKNK